MKKLLLSTLLFFTLFNCYPQCQRYEPLDWWHVAVKDFFERPPIELYRGRFKPDDRRYGNPYTLIDRDKNPDANTAFVKIREHLQNKSNEELRTFYKTVYNSAKSSRPETGGNETEGYSPLAVWTKYNAFVFIIGLDPSQM